MGSADDRGEGRYAGALLDRFRLGLSTADGGALAQARRSIHLHGFRHWFVRERDAFVQTAKAAVASGLAWVVAAGLIDVKDPVLASVAALVTVQVTVYQSLWRAVQYSAGIVAGMVAALAIGAGLGVNVLTMSLVVVAGLVLGRTLRLGTQVNQVAVTALLVLSFGGNYGYTRVYDSIIGAAVGVAVNALIAPPAFSRTAAKELADLADDLATLTARVAKAVRGGWSHEDAQKWLARSRELSADARAPRKIAQQAEEAVKFHPRRSAHLTEVHRVDEAAVALDHLSTQLNSLMRGLSDMRATFSPVPEKLREVPEEMALLLDDTAKAMSAFGRLQLPDKASIRVYEELSELIKRSKPHARKAAQVMHPDEDAPTLVWSVHGALLDDARRMLRELDPDDGPHRAGIPAFLRAYATHPAR
ncbi:MAG TPA: aromatic acid exporter family protein [Actinospica sp.]|nr:aromatic acid exporter family protein [Actinospica sp.]